jgi:hypothetical protein
MEKMEFLQHYCLKKPKREIVNITNFKEKQWYNGKEI